MRLVPWLVMLLATLAPGSDARACSVPVFRYALERWKPSPYEVHVYHRGPLTPAQQKHLETLEEASNQANFTVARIDLAGKTTPTQRTRWQLHGKKISLPAMLVPFPDDDEKAPPAWSGPLEEAAIRKLTDSPARRNLVKLLARGESGVWVVLTGGDRKADDAAVKLLDRELARLQGELKLPVQEDEAALKTRLPLRLSFAVLRVSRDDPAEEAFVRMLLGSDEDLDGVKGPIVFPIFGRGRVLLGLHGKLLSPGQVERWATFLIGPCSCQVKELNPGVDLLLTASWDELLDVPEEPEVPTTRPELTAPKIPPGMAAVKREPEEADKGEIESGRRGWWLSLGLGAMLMLATGAWVLLGRRLGGAGGRADWKSKITD